MSTGRERSGVTASSKADLLAIEVNGEQVLVDPRTLSMGERSVMKRELAKLGYEPDATDSLVATIWVVMRRDDKALTFEEVCDAITVGSLEDALPVPAEEVEENPPS